MTDFFTLTPQEARIIAKDAFIYAYPMVDSHRILFAFFLWPNNAEYKGPLNTLLGKARLFTPSDTSLRLYVPQQAAINGTWQTPPLKRVTPSLHWTIKLKRIFLAFFRADGYLRESPGSFKTPGF
ncbi:MAG: hypothetical protein AAGI69_01190 [Cyanobacteria bacterium P01_H01_bin.21]